jgi:hypothetical protein
MTLADALSRTILLAKTELREETPDKSVLLALTSTRVVLVSTEDCLQSHAAQSSYVTTALTLARSGHSVWLSAPDVPLVGPQPPLRGDRLISSLDEIGRDLLPDRHFHIGTPEDRVELAILIGVPEFIGEADQVARLGWSKWGARLSSDAGASCIQTDWPIGAMAAAALASAEAFKATMRKLREHARVSPWLFDQIFAATRNIGITLAPEETPTDTDLGQFDMVSGGAIANAALFTLLRLPRAQGSCRIFDDDSSELSNLNRNALLRRSDLTPSQPKVNTLAEYSGNLVIEPCPIRYDENFCGRSLAHNVLVGVDHIPSRWAVQRHWPAWLGVGATDAFSAFVSFHAIGLPCVGCLHPEPLIPSGPIPTVAFVSFFAGLLLGTYLVRHVAGGMNPAQEQQAFLTVIRPETWTQNVVTPNARCPVTCDFGLAAASA